PQDDDIAGDGGEPGGQRGRLAEVPAALPIPHARIGGTELGGHLFGVVGAAVVHDEDVERVTGVRQHTGDLGDDLHEVVRFVECRQEYGERLHRAHANALRSNLYVTTSSTFDTRVSPAM